MTICGAFVISLLFPTIALAQSHELLVDMHSVSYRLKIYDDGNVGYFDYHGGRVPVVTRKTLDAEHVKQLTDAFDQADFFSLKDIYNSSQTILANGTAIGYFSGRPTTKLRFVHEGKDKTVRYSVQPPPLQELHNQVRAIVGIEFELRDYPKK